MKPTPLLTAAAIAMAGCTSPRGFPPNGMIQNCDRVDSVLWRSAQPTNLGLEWLKRQGVKSVINLRDDVITAEPWVCQSLGLEYKTYPLSGVNRPSKEQVEEILAEIERLPQPVLVHCQHGCDRTGVIVASWRIRHGWKPEDALAEAKAYGLSPLLPGFHRFIRELR